MDASSPFISLFISIHPWTSFAFFMSLIDYNEIYTIKRDSRGFFKNDPKCKFFLEGCHHHQQHYHHRATRGLSLLNWLNAFYVIFVYSNDFFLLSLLVQIKEFHGLLTLFSLNYTVMVISFSITCGIVLFIKIK